MGKAQCVEVGGAQAESSGLEVDTNKQYRKANVHELERRRESAIPSAQDWLKIGPTWEERLSAADECSNLVLRPMS